MRRRHQVIQSRTREKNRLKELNSIGGDKFLVDDINDSIKVLDKRVERITKAALTLVRGDQELNHWRLMLSSMPGIADVTAMVLTAELIHLPADISGRQLTAYAGLDPKRNQSGKYEGRRTISRRGNKRLRSSLYLSASIAGGKNPHVRAWKEKQLARGKAPKLVNVAIARRFLHVIAYLRETDSRWDGERFHSLGKA